MKEGTIRVITEEGREENPQKKKNERAQGKLKSTRVAERGSRTHREKGNHPLNYHQKNWIRKKEAKGASKKEGLIRGKNSSIIKKQERERRGWGSIGKEKNKQVIDQRESPRFKSGENPPELRDVQGSYRPLWGEEQNLTPDVVNMRKEEIKKAPRNSCPTLGSEKNGGKREGKGKRCGRPLRKGGDGRSDTQRPKWKNQEGGVSGKNDCTKIKSRRSK